MLLSKWCASEHARSLPGLFTLTQPLDDKRESNEGDEHDIGFLEAGKMRRKLRFTDEGKNLCLHFGQFNG